MGWVMKSIPVPGTNTGVVMSRTDMAYLCKTFIDLEMVACYLIAQVQSSDM